MLTIIELAKSYTSCLEKHGINSANTILLCFAPTTALFIVSNPDLTAVNKCAWVGKESREECREAFENPLPFFEEMLKAQVRYKSRQVQNA